MINFDEQTHTYTRNNVPYTSVTTVLKNYGLSANYTNIPKDILDAAAQRGHVTHKALENYIKHGTMDPNDINLCNFEKYIIARNIDLTIAKSEEIVFNDTYRIAGTIDFQYQDNGSDVIADFKTTSQIHWESVAWQLSIYAFIKCKGDIIQYYIYRLKVIHIHNGKLSVKEVPTIEYDEVVKLLNANLTGAPYTYAPDLTKIVSSSEAVMLKAILDDIDQCETLLKDLNKKKEEYSNRISERMQTNNLHQCNIDNISITYTDTTTRKTLDTQKVKELCNIHGVDISNLYKISTVNSRCVIKKK